MSSVTAIFDLSGGIGGQRLTTALSADRDALIIFKRESNDVAHDVCVISLCNDGSLAVLHPETGALLYKLESNPNADLPAAAPSEYAAADAVRPDTDTVATVHSRFCDPGCPDGCPGPTEESERVYGPQGR